MNKGKIVEMIEEQHGVLIKKIKDMNIPEPKKISINGINEVEEVLSELKSIIGESHNEPIIYLIMLKEKINSLKLLDNIKKLFNKIKTKKGKENWQVSEINDYNWTFDSSCLYVGRSFGEIMGRMRRHLGKEKLSRKTYSLWLNDWYWNRESGLPPKIEIYFYVFKGMSDEELYMIEDLFWRGLSPLFGSSGKSPKS